jgi:xylan 1,4-beta-xylosidase
MSDFLDHVNSGTSAANGKAVPMDFISFHVKGVPKISEGKVTMGLAHEVQDADKGFEVIAKYPRFKQMPIILSEADPEGCAACSSKVNPANNYRNGTLYPAYTAAAYKSLFELQDLHGVNLLAMLSWSFEFEGKEYFEGFRSLSTNGIDKPVLNFFRMAALMAGDRVATRSDGQVALTTLLKSGVREASDVDALATSGERQAAVMVWNYHDVDGPAPGVPTTVTVSGIPKAVGKVLVTHFRIDDTHSNAYTVWKAMGSPQHPTSEQYVQLQGAAGLAMFDSPEWVEVTGGQIRLTTEMPRQSVSLFRLTW